MGEQIPVILHGDYRTVLTDVCADLIFTSPPYNIGSKQSRCDGRRKIGLYDPKSYGAITDYPDAMPEADYQDSQAQFLVWAADHLQPDGVLVYNHKPRRKDGRMIHPAVWFLQPAVTRRLVLMEEIIWDRGSTHNHGRGLLWPQTERLYVFRRVDGTYMLRNTDALPHRADLWRVPLTTHTGGHNAPFTLMLARAVVCAFSRPGALVCDPYLGSGTAAVAAVESGRRFVGAEQLRKYYDLATRRLQPLLKVA